VLDFLLCETDFLDCLGGGRLCDFVNFA